MPRFSGRNLTAAYNSQVAKILTVVGNNNDTLRNMLLYTCQVSQSGVHTTVCVCVHSDGIRVAVPADKTEGSREYTRSAEEEERRSSSSSHSKPTTGRCNIVSAAPPVCCSVNVKCSGVMLRCSAGCQTVWCWETNGGADEAKLRSDSLFYLLMPELIVLFFSDWLTDSVILNTELYHRTWPCLLWNKSMWRNVWSSTSSAL